MMTPKSLEKMTRWVDMSPSDMEKNQGEKLL